MDMFFAYLLVASATPLFIWLDKNEIQRIKCVCFVVVF